MPWPSGYRSALAATYWNFTYPPVAPDVPPGAMSQAQTPLILAPSARGAAPAVLNGAIPISVGLMPRLTSMVVVWFLAVAGEWRRGNKATALTIALLPAWLFLALGVLVVFGSIKSALVGPGVSDVGTAIGAIGLLAAGITLVVGPIWSLRALSRVLPDRASSQDVLVGNVDLGEPDHVLGCAYLVLFPIMVVVGFGVMTIVQVAYDAVGTPGKGLALVNAAGLLLFVGFVFVFPAIGTLVGVQTLKGWMIRRG